MIDAMIKSAILLGVVAIATRLLQRRTASLRHMLWSFAIVGAVAIPVLSRLAPFQLRVLPPADTFVRPRGATSKHDANAPAARLLPNDAETAETGHTLSSPPSVAPTAVDSSFTETFPWMTAFAAVWVLGALILLARLVVGLTIVQRIANRARDVADPDWRAAIERAGQVTGVRFPVAVRFSDEVPVPYTCGLARPIIVLPTSANEWNAERRDAVLLHELAHISRGDLAMNILSHVMRAMYWLNPLAWLAAHRLRVEGERACDDTVLRAGAKPSDYADHLLTIVRAAGRPVPKVALAMARSSDFEGRLLAILEPGVPRARLGRARAAGLALIFLAALTPLAAMTSAPGAPASVVYKYQDVPSAKPFNTAPLPPASSTVTALAEAAVDASASVRLAAVNSLGQLQDPAAIAALAKALKEDTDARVREAAAWALGEIDDNRAVPHLLDALKTERVTKVREKIVEALADIKDANALPGVSAVLKDAAPEVRRAAVHALSEFEDQAAAPALIGLIRDDDVEVRRGVAEALGQLENPVAIDALSSMTHDADSEVRANAIESLHHFRDQKLIPVFVAALKDSSARVRQHAADALGSVDLKTAPRALIDALLDQNREVRKQAAQSLANIGDEAAVPALKKLVGDGDPQIRRAGAEALKDIGGADAIQALMALLKDPDPEVRKTAAEALGKKR
jgi:HEAT repeat protein/beta-lactamase regulating signal transducer with metallopeptidase domain